MGAGVKAQYPYGSTDRFGHKAVEKVTTVHGFHATILHPLGLGHEKLTFYYYGLKRRLTDIEGHVIREILILSMDVVVYLTSMGLRARVQNGRLILDEPTSLPDGTMLDLVLDDEGDDLTLNERKALDDAISKAWTSAKKGSLRPAQSLIDELRARR